MAVRLVRRALRMPEDARDAGLARSPLGATLVPRLVTAAPARRAAASRVFLFCFVSGSPSAI